MLWLFTNKNYKNILCLYYFVTDNPTQRLDLLLENSATPFRSVFISDTHLGFKGAQNKPLNGFLDLIKDRTEELYIVGDFIDLWEMKKKNFFKKKHADTLTKVMKIAKNVNTYYIPGNHDEYFRELIGEDFGHLHVVKDYDYTTLDGRLLHVLHGDVYDLFMKPENRWISHLGSSVYGLLVSVSQTINKIQRVMGRPHWSLSYYVKDRSKNIASIIGNFEETIILAAKKQHYDGVICGHIHKPEIKTINGLDYYNTGDWVDSCSALMETKMGEFKLYHWYAEHPR
jgi:UDP-2,3-diacylglucosamine pyrophosphatase LpxH